MQRIKCCKAMAARCFFFFAFAKAEDKHYLMLPLSLLTPTPAPTPTQTLGFAAAAGAAVVRYFCYSQKPARVALSYSDATCRSWLTNVSRAEQSREAKHPD